MPRPPKAKAAVLERSRRSTAGKRMSSLIGKAQEDDDAFWSHSIWSESGGGYADGRSRKRRKDNEDGSSSSDEEEEEEEEGSNGGGGGSGDEDDSTSDGEGSYHMSDEDSAAAADQFDSDFDESESDEGGDGEEGDGEEEKELHAEERRDAASKRKKNQRLGVTSLQSTSAGRELMKKKTGRVTRRGPLGEGWNEGLVLNWPPSSVETAGTAVAKGPYRPRISDSTSAIVPSAQSIPHIPTVAEPTNPPRMPSRDIERIDKEVQRLPPQRDLPPAATSAPGSPAVSKLTSTQLKNQLKQEAISERKKSQRIQFTQEELILESIKFTERENAKWLNARKRSKEAAAQFEKSTGSSSKRSSNQRLISRFHSRRGCNTTITFMDMDHLPEILTRGHTSYSVGHSASYAGSTTPTRRRRLGSSSSEASETTQPTPEKKHEKCVITGKVAKYRDPKSMLGYHDLDAFKELRRRLDAGKLKISRPAIHKINRENNGANSERKGPKTTNFASASGQPMMIAEMASMGPNKAKVMVKVTQGGVPVSPPSIPGLPFYLPSELPFAVEGLRENRKEPALLLPSLPSIGDVGVGEATNRQLCGGVDLGIKMESSKEHHAVICKRDDAPIAKTAIDSRTPDLSISPADGREFQFFPFPTDKGSPHLDNKRGPLAVGGKETDSGWNEDVAILDAGNHIGEVDCTKPQVALGSNEIKNAKKVQCNEAIASPSPAIKINIKAN
ncbi:hypothetical protein ACHAXA_010970 [Cyclostephanos tholiformis]|uniref:Vps72/YL1 C-terminal domain-containing protein n=1 Tax=Cyclostephanos tholiformis TaxID=382380 RepID=A0ABD3RZY7_9STRA